MYNATGRRIGRTDDQQAGSMIKIGLRRRPGVVGKNHLDYKDDGKEEGAEDTALSLSNDGNPARGGLRIPDTSCVLRETHFQLVDLFLFNMKSFSKREKRKEFYSEHPYTQHQGLTINILLQFFITYLALHPSVWPSYFYTEEGT